MRLLPFFRKIFIKINIINILFTTTNIFVLISCSYHLGIREKQVPGGYKQVFISIFKNKSQETGIEIYFTNALIKQLERAQITIVSNKFEAEVIINGEIESIQYVPRALKLGGDLPEGSVLATEYQILINTNVKVIRNSDKRILWQGNFKGERIYPAPQVGAYGINSVNPIYNLNAKRDNIKIIAHDMMIEALDRMTENF